MDTVNRVLPPASSAQPDAAAAPPDAGLKLQQLLGKAEELRDPVARALLHECLSSLLTFYGEGLNRLLAVIRECGAATGDILDRLAKDKGIRTMLLVHGLHPLDLPARLQQAIDKVRPYMESHGGNVELLSLENDFARFRLQGTCKTCPSSSITLELALRGALEDACPDLAGFAVEGVEPAPADATPRYQSCSQPQPDPAPAVIN